MTEFVDRMNLDELVFDDDFAHRSSDPYSPAKIFGVAFLGAAVAVSAYCVYNQLDPERRNRIKENVVSFVTSQVGAQVASVASDVAASVDQESADGRNGDAQK